MKIGATTVEISVTILGKLEKDSDIQFLGICPKDFLSYHRDTCSSIFIDALFTIA